MHHYFATVARGLESVAAQELERLGATSVQPGFAGVSFQGDFALLYRINLWARIPFRILWKLGEISCRTADDLYGEIQAMDWSRYLSPAHTLAVRATGSNRQLNHTHFTALQVKNAIVDQQQQRLGVRSPVDTDEPDVLVNVHIHRDRAIVSLDSSAASLHRRGYRPAMGDAPLKETLAAALIAMTDWQPDLPFVDPMCGSGTLPLEACLQSLNIAPGLFRLQFGFERWPGFDAQIWQDLLDEAESQQRSHLAAPIVGSDENASVIEQARSNALSCGVAADLTLKHQALDRLEPPGDRGVILCNPPYGARLGNAAELGSLYKQLGDVFKQRFKGWTAYVLSGNPELSSHIGLKASRRMVVYNGAIECRLLKYELY